MGCCGSTTTGAGAAPLDTGKRVNYTKGMLLGVDDFVQEQAWHIARRHELAREVLGYGTVRGLQVAAEGAPPQVRVTPGVALMPSGTPVCVASEQCCDLNGWLGTQWDKDVGDAVKRLPAGAALPVYVVLAYDSCLTDLMPVPGEPCRSEEALTASSRIADCFRLELRLRPPEQIEENAIRDFADWLAQVPVDRISPPLTERQFLDGLCDAAHGWLHPSSPPPGDFMLGTPPAGLESTDALLRAALRLWATELRPLWRAKYGCGPHPVAPGGPDDALLLGALQVRLTGRQAQVPVPVLEDTRPVLMSLRMLQEMITQNPAPEPALTVVAADRFGLSAEVGLEVAYARADHSHGTPTPSGDAEALDVGSPGVQELRVIGLRGDPIAATPAVADDVLVFDGAAWVPRQRALPAADETDPVPETLFGLKPALGSDAAHYARADHSHGTPLLQGDVDAVDVPESEPPAQTLRVKGLQGEPVSDAAPRDGQVLTYGKIGPDTKGWMAQTPTAVPLAQTSAPSRVVLNSTSVTGTSAAYARADHVHGMDALPAAGGDASGTLAGLTVIGLRGRAIDPQAPLDGQTLVYRQASKLWVPTTPASGPGAPPPLGGDLSGAVDSAFIERLQKVPVKAPEPTADDVLTFDGEAWVPRKAGGTAGSFVEREAGPYRLVAAGHARVTMTGPKSGQVTMRTAYAGLEGHVIGPRSPVEVRLAFKAAVRNPTNLKFGFIVKLTPVWTEVNDSNSIEFSPYLVDLVKPSADTIDFQVRLRLSTEAGADQRYELQIEVSRFEL